MTKYSLPMFERLHPRTEWRGSRITDMDILTLTEAAELASRHAGEQVTVTDFIRAAARGEIPLRAIIERQVKTKPCHSNHPPLNDGVPIPAGAIPTLPISACRELAVRGSASWRTFDSHEQHNGIWMRYTAWEFADDEPDLHTKPSDCRVIGYDCRALADAFCTPATPMGNSKKSAQNQSCAPEKWSRGLKLVAWESASSILSESKILNAGILEDRMRKDGRVAVSGEILQFNIPDASLKRGEDEVKVTTLANWVTAIKRERENPSKLMMINGESP